MTIYRLLLTSRAQKDIDRLFPALRHQIATALEKITQNPFMGKALKGEFQGLHSYRMGTHRIIYQIHAREILVIVLKVGHRREIYRR